MQHVSCIVHDQMPIYHLVFASQCAPLNSEKQQQSNMFSQFFYCLILFSSVIFVVVASECTLCHVQSSNYIFILHHRPIAQWKTILRFRIQFFSLRVCVSLSCACVCSVSTRICIIIICTPINQSNRMCVLVAWRKVRIKLNKEQKW